MERTTNYNFFSAMPVSRRSYSELENLDLHDIHQLLYVINGKKNFIPVKGEMVLDKNEKRNRLGEAIKELPNYFGLTYELVEKFKDREEPAIGMKYKGRFWVPDKSSALPKNIVNLLQDLKN